MNNNNYYNIYLGTYLFLIILKDLVIYRIYVVLSYLIDISRKKQFVIIPIVGKTYFYISIILFFSRFLLLATF